MERTVIPAIGTRALEAPSMMRAAPRSNAATQMRAVLYRQRFVLLGSLLAALALGLLAVVLLPKTYTASASVQLEQQTPQIIAAPGLDPEPEDANRFLQTQLDRVHSKTLALEVAEMIRLSQMPAVQAALGLENPTEEEMLETLREGVLADLGLNTRLAQISFTSRSPNASALIANAYAAALVADNIRGKVQTSNQAQKYLLEQLNDTKSKLEESERRMLAYARTAGLTSTTSGEDTQIGSMPGQQIDQLSASLAAATARRIDAQQEWAQVQGVSARTLPQVQENRAYQELLARKAQLQADLAQDRQRHTDEYPTVAATRVQIDELEREIAALAGNIKASVRQRYQAAAQQEAQLQSTIASLRGEAMAEQERGVGYNSLERQVETDRMAYDGLLQRYKEVSAASGAPSANVMLVDRAEPPLDPSSARPAWIMALALVLGIIAGMALALLREAINRPIRSLDDLEGAADLSALGAVPALARGSDMADALRQSDSPQSESYKSIAAAMRHFGGAAMPRSMLITSTSANEGKSSSAWGLARGLRTLGYSVVVVHADLRNPSAEPGLAEALAGEADLTSLARVNHRAGLAAIDAGHARGDLVALLAPDRVRPVIDKLQSFADIVLVDGPPIMGLADAVLLAESVEAVVMVVEANRTDPQHLDAALARLPDTVPAAAILTKYDARRAGAGQSAESYYSYGKGNWHAHLT
ncbi:MAG: hypothetical protein EX262_06535 [Sphingomonadaceae bacterium]|nr:MAG: hypothetical protein EX262_06535 [Sphingomonadaceae bacterium]